MSETHTSRRKFTTRVFLLIVASLAATFTVAEDGSGAAGLTDSFAPNAVLAEGDRAVANGGSITASVWLDADADGRLDKTENGLANVLVSLMRCDGSFVDSGVTNAIGSATFGRVPQGCYRLRFNETAGYRYCPTDIDNANLFDSDANPTTGLTDSIVVTDAFESRALYAGVIAVSDSEIGDRVWEDTNANGFQDMNEDGLAGVQVNLLDCAGDAIADESGQPMTTLSEADGSFSFGTLNAGCYRLGFVAPNTHNFSASDTPFESYDSDADVQSGLTTSINISGAAAQLNLDAGLYRPASIGDWVWHDLNGDGVQNANESGMADVQVVLLDGNGTPTGRVTHTDADGFYSFNNIVPGSYRLQFAAPNGYVFSQFSETADINLDSDANGLGVTPAFAVGSGADIRNKDVAVRQFDGPRVGLEKLTNGDDADDATGPFIPVGTDVLWEYVVTNLGNVPFTNVQVIDDQGVSVTCPQDTLAVGESITCTGSTDDAQSGQYQNTGTACGVAPTGLTWCDKDDSHYFGSDPAITIEKLTNGADSDAAPGEFIVPGSDVTWEYIVTNTGNVTLNNVLVTDDQGVVVNCPSMSLEPGIAMSCFGTGTAIEGQYANLGSVTGEPPVGGPVDDSDPSHYFGPSASIDIEKSTNGEDADNPTGPAIYAGQTVTWIYTVTNTGSITLNNVVVTDSDPTVSVSCPADSLAPGESFDCSATGTATAGQYANQSVATGQGVDPNGDPVGDPVSDDDPSHYFGADPSISIEKATNGEDADTPTGPTLTEGDDVEWTYVVTNTGNVALENVVVTDDQGVAVSCPQDTLAIGESFTCTATGTATVGQYMNLGTVTATGLDPNNEPLPPGPPITDDDPSHYIGEPQPTASLGDKVFKDLNSDGQQGADEPGVPGVTVNLWTDDDGNGTPDTQIGSTTTDSDGMYGFADLDPDLTYVVQFINDPAMNMPFTTPNVGDDSSDSDAGDGGITGPIDLDPGENDPTIDAGIVNLPASLGDKVFKDLDSDGQQDADEPGVPGITVNLWTDDDGDGLPDTQIDTTTTDANGMYAFTDLDPTLTYVVQFVNDPAMNMPFTTPNVGDDSSDSDAGDGGITGPINLESGENNPTIDAGLVNLPASLGDKVFKDLNNNGQQDADEPGVPGITVNLWTDDDGDGLPDTQINTTTTDANGMYGFTDLDPTLTYVVQFVNDPAMNMPFTVPNVGDDASDSDAGDGGITGPINLASGENNPTIDAGLINLVASLGDKVFKDLNGDGQQDADEPGVPGITVNLWTDDDGDGLPDTQISSTTTDANGMYNFTDLDPTLVYVVQFVNDPAMNMPFTTPNVGDDASDSDAGPEGITGPITLTSGQNNPTIDAGLVNLPASLGDKVFKDLNSNGQQDVDEPGVPGITVNLWTDDDGDGSPDTQIDSTTTDANGMYGFADLDPTLTYVVQFVNDPAMNMPFTTPNVGDDSSDSDAGDGGITGPINLASGENNPTIDAGLVNLLASLGDKVFKDLNSNGQQDAGEPGVPGITVNLWTDDNGDGAPNTQIGTTTTDADGMYGYTNLDPTLTYVVQFVNDPAMNMPFTTPNVGNDALDSDAGAGGITGPINLASGENNPTIDAGIVNLPASLGDKVFKDLNGNGQQDAGEPGVADITVNLWTDDDGDGSPDTQIDSTTTDANGMYGFTDLDPTLTYVVQFVNDPAMNMPFTTPNVGDDASDSDAGDGGITGPINLASGETNNTIDAGLVNLPASLGDKVFKDLDSDGQQDVDEPGVAGFTVNLWTDDDGDGSPDTQIDSTTTDGDGMYGFSDLDPTLVYVVQFVNDPAMNMPFTTPNVGDDASDSDAGAGGITGPINLAPGENNPTIDAGVVNVPDVCVPGYVADHFNHVSYNNNDGDMDWLGPWVEHDPEGGGAHSGNVMIDNGKLILNDHPNSGTEPSIRRSVDLSDYPSAMLMFDWSTSDEVNTNDSAVLEISSDGGNTYHVLRTYTNLDGWNDGSEVIDISGFISANTTIRFRINDYYGAQWDKFMVDNVRIDKKCDDQCVPGYVKDHFSHVSYNNNDGDMDWEGPWHEYDPQGGGAHSGNVMIEGGQLVLNDYPNSDSHPDIQRVVDLSGYNSAMLSFDWSISYEANENDLINLWISPDGGHTWHVLDTFAGEHGQTTTGSEMYDISAFIGENTIIAFQVAQNFGAVWDKFMVNFIRVDKKCDGDGPGPQVCTTDVSNTPYHGIYLPNFVTNGEIDLYNFESDAQFERNADGTATLTGTAYKQGQPDYKYWVNVTMSGGTSTPPPGSPKNSYNYDTSDWFYYPNWSGTLTGLAWNTGASVSITRTGPAFQIGTGANDHPGEGNQYGGSGWLDWTANSQPNDCDYYGDCVNHEGSGDINVRIEECPL